SGTWTYTFTTALSATGTYNLTATQSDSFSNVGTSGTQVVTIDTTAPVVSITSVNGTARSFPYSTNLTVSSVGGACGSASGDSATVSIALTGGSTQNGTASCTGGVWTFTFATSLSATANYTVTAIQLDAAGNTGTSGGQVITIDQTPPTVALTSVNGTARAFP